LSSLDLHGSQIAHEGLRYYGQNSAYFNARVCYTEPVQYRDPGR
jgi:hypothetical protein